MYNIIEVTINGQKVNPKDIVVKWVEWDGNEYSGEIESYAYAVAQCEASYFSREVGMVEN